MSKNTLAHDSNSVICFCLPCVYERERQARKADSENGKYWFFAGLVVVFIAVLLSGIADHNYQVMTGWY